jgi:hypothetical protein
MRDRLDKREAEAGTFCRPAGIQPPETAPGLAAKLEPMLRKQGRKAQEKIKRGG